MENNKTINEIVEKLKSFTSEYYFDTHTTPPFNKVTSLIDEAYIAKILTKLAVGTATVWWSMLELKEMLALYKRSKKFKG